MNPARLRAYAELLIATVIWGIAGPIIKYTLGGISTLPFLTYRFLLSSVLSLIIFFFIKPTIPRNLKSLFTLFAFGFLTSTGSLGLLFFGLENTTVLDMTLITLIAPLVVSIAGVIYLKEHITLREKIGMGIALFGTIVTVVEPLILNHDGITRLSGNLLILLYLAVNTVAVIIGKKLLREGVSPLTLTNTSFIIGLITILPFAVFTDYRSLMTIHYSYHLGVIYMALLSGSLAYYLSNRAQKTIEVGEAAVFSYLYPLFSAPLAIFWLGEKITYKFIIGAVIITVGVLIAEIKKKRYNTSSSEG